MKEVILYLRGRDNLTTIVAAVIFVIFINWYNLLLGGEAFQVNTLPNLPHQDPFIFLRGKYKYVPRNFITPNFSSGSQTSKETIRSAAFGVCWVNKGRATCASS